MVRGYHIYKDVWDATLHKDLVCMRELSSLCDPFSVAVLHLEQIHPVVQLLRHSLVAYHLKGTSPYSAPFGSSS